MCSFCTYNDKTRPTLIVHLLSCFFGFLIPSKTVLEYITFTAKLYSSVKEKTQITEKYISWLFERREYTNME